MSITLYFTPDFFNSLVKTTLTKFKNYDKTLFTTALEQEFSEGIQIVLFCLNRVRSMNPWIRLLLIILPFMAWISHIIVITVKFSARERKFRLFISLILILMTYFSNMYTILHRLAYIMHDPIKSVTYFFLAISLCNLVFLSLSCSFVFAEVRNFLSTDTEINSDQPIVRTEGL